MRLQERVYELVVFDSGVLRSYSVLRVVGLGVEVLVSGFVGYAYTSTLSRESIGQAIDKAMKLAKALSARGREVGLARVEGVKALYRTRYAQNPLEVDPSEKVSLVRDLNTIAMGVGGIVSAVTRLGCEMDKRVVVSSLGAEAFSEVVAVGISNLSVARFGEVMERVSDQKTFIGGYESIKSFDWSSFVEDISKLAVNASQAKTPPPGAYRAVIDNELIGLLLHEAFGHATEGDLVMYRASVLCRRLGERVAGDLVTIVDDGAVPNMPGSTPFDDEGVATKRKVVFDRGVLRTYLYDTYTANIDNRESTGNAKRMGASNTYPDATNILVLPGTSSLDSLVRDMNRGIVVHGTIGEWLSNPVSGYPNATVTHGFLVEGGEVKQAVKSVVLAGDAYKLLKEGLAALSKEAEAIVNYIVPAVLLSGVSVAGE